MNKTVKAGVAASGSSLMSLEGPRDSEVFRPFGPGLLCDLSQGSSCWSHSRQRTKGLPAPRSCQVGSGNTKKGPYPRPSEPG